MIINPSLLPYGVPQKWSTLHSICTPTSTQTKLETKSFQSPASSHYPKSSLTPVDQCGLVIFNAGDYFDQLILFHILIYILITDMQWYALS